MMNKEVFWELIEKNKYNPINFQEKAKDMDIKDMFEFYKLIEKMEELFCGNSDVEKFWYNLYERKIYKLSCDEIMFRGKEFYDAFMNCDEDKIKIMLNDNPNWSQSVMTVESIQNIYGLKVANDEEIKQINNGDEVTKYFCFLKFWDKVDELGFRNNKKPIEKITVEKLLEDKSRKLIETRVYKPSKLYLKALESEEEITGVFKPYVYLYRKLCLKEITKEGFIVELRSQLENKHGSELEELNNLWKMINKGYDANTYCISNIIHLIIMEIFFPEEKCVDIIIDKYIHYYKTENKKY